MTQQELRQVFSTAVSVDEMSLLLARSPFCRYVVTDFYDGATEGFACVSRSAWVYFKKTWWDDGQDLRVFWAYVLKNLSDESRAALERCSSEDSSRVLSSEEATRLKELAAEAVQERESRMTMVCRDISRELVIFSDVPD